MKYLWQSLLLVVPSFFATHAQAEGIDCGFNYALIEYYASSDCSANLQITGRLSSGGYGCLRFESDGDYMGMKTKSIRIVSKDECIEIGPDFFLNACRAYGDIDYGQNNVCATNE